MRVFSLGALLSRQSTSLLGLDISASSMKLVELRPARRDEWVLERYAVVPLKPGWVTDGGIENFVEVAEAVQQLVRQSGVRSRQVAMALPSSAVITKRIVLPRGLSDAELELLVQGEANQYIPFPMDEVSLDFCVLGPCVASASDVDVLIAAARREKVQDMQGLAEAAGLKPVAVDVASLAARLAARRLLPSLPNLPPQPVVALFELGESTTRLQVLQDDELLYERDQSFGDSVLVSLLASEVAGGQEEAARRVCQADWPDERHGEALRSYAQSAAQELVRALQIFYASTSHAKVDHVLLSGMTATAPGLLASLRSLTGAACSAVNPFSGMALGASVQPRQLKRCRASLLTACGLALRRPA